MSDQSIRITRASLPGARLETSSGKNQTGTLDGMKLALRTVEDDVDEQIQMNFHRQNFGLDAPRQQILLKQMKLEASDRPPEFNDRMIRQYLKALGNNKNAAELTQNLLRQLINGAPISPKGNSQKEVAEFAIALHRLDAALRGSDDDFIGWLSPLSQKTPDLETLAKQLQDAAGDEKQMHALLADFRGLPEDEKETAKKFGTACFDSKSLREELRNMQQLPQIDENLKRQISESLKDEINEIHRQHGTHLSALRNLLEKAGDLASLDLAESYDQLVHGNVSGFAATMEILVARHSENELINTIIPVIEKTLSHELSLGDDQRSVDKEKLHAILSEIQHMNILKAMIERIGIFVSSLGRMYGISAA